MKTNPSNEEMKVLWQKASEFIQKNNIGCAETIYQVDRINENSYDLIREICEIVGYLPNENYEDN